MQKMDFCRIFQGEVPNKWGKWGKFTLFTVLTENSTDIHFDFPIILKPQAQRAVPLGNTNVQFLLSHSVAALFKRFLRKFKRAATLWLREGTKADVTKSDGTLCL